MSEFSESELLPAVRSLDPYEFEEFVAALWELQGWETEVTGQSGDRGIDIIAKQEFPIKTNIHIQVKRYDKDSRVSGPEMQKYASLVQRPDADLVVVITSSSFTSQAVSLANEFNIKLINGPLLARLIQQLDADKLLINYIENDEVREVDCKEDTNQSGLIHIEDTPYNSTEDIQPSSTVASGEWLQLKLIGAEQKSGYIVEGYSKGEYQPVDGLVLAFEVTNISEENCIFNAQNSDSGGGGIVGFDTQGFSYEAVSKYSYVETFQETVGNWNWSDVTIKSKSRSRVATWLNINQDIDIRSIEYEEKIWRGTDNQYYLFNEELSSSEPSEKIHMTFTQPIEDAVGELPDPIQDSIK